MIAKLKGRIDTIAENYVILDVNGVGYLVYASAKCLARLGDVGTAAELLIETHVREDHIHLYGFADAEVKNWFQTLCTVQGVGTKVALAILSVATPAQLAMGIAAQDKAIVTQADGVGPKLAVRILTELKDKAGKMALTALGGGFEGKAQKADKTTAEPELGAGLKRDAVSALMNLGYSQSEAFQIVTQTAAQMGDDIELGRLIRESLKAINAQSAA